MMQPIKLFVPFVLALSSIACGGQMAYDSGHDAGSPVPDDAGVSDSGDGQTAHRQAPTDSGSEDPQAEASTEAVPLNGSYNLLITTGAECMRECHPQKGEIYRVDLRTMNDGRVRCVVSGEKMHEPRVSEAREDRGKLSFNDFHRSGGIFDRYQLGIHSLTFQISGPGHLNPEVTGRGALLNGPAAAGSVEEFAIEGRLVPDDQAPTVRRYSSYLRAPWFPVRLHVSEAIPSDALLAHLPRILTSTEGLNWFAARDPDGIGVQQAYGYLTNWDDIPKSKVRVEVAGGIEDPSGNKSARTVLLQYFATIGPVRAIHEFETQSDVRDVQGGELAEGTLAASCEKGSCLVLQGLQGATPSLNARLPFASTVAVRLRQFGLMGKIHLSATTPGSNKVKVVTFYPSSSEIVDAPCPGYPQAKCKSSRWVTLELSTASLPKASQLGVTLSLSYSETDIYHMQGDLNDRIFVEWIKAE